MKHILFSLFAYNDQTPNFPASAHSNMFSRWIFLPRIGSIYNLHAYIHTYIHTYISAFHEMGSSYSDKKLWRRYLTPTQHIHPPAICCSRSLVKHHSTLENSPSRTIPFHSVSTAYNILPPHRTSQLHPRYLLHRITPTKVPPMISTTTFLSRHCQLFTYLPT